MHPNTTKDLIVTPSKRVVPSTATISQMHTVNTTRKRKIKSQNIQDLWSSFNVGPSLHLSYATLFII